MKVSYNTNWMGIANTDWYRERSLLREKLITVTEDSILSKRFGYKVGDVTKREEIIEEYSCGRIDVCNGEPYGTELSVPPMRAEDWNAFSDWLDNIETDDVWTLEQLVELFEKTNPKIRWGEEVE